MGNRRRSTIDAEARRRLHGPMLREGGKIRRARKRRGWTQQYLGQRVGLSQSAISDLEVGEGGGLSQLVWQKVAIVLGLPLELTLGRDALQEPEDAGHLGIQELVLRLGRAAGRNRTFELPTKPSDPARSTDVGVIDDVHSRLILVECVNTFGNVNAAIRSSDRKRSEAQALAISIGYGEPYTVHLVWVVRSTRRNRELIARYPEIFSSRFTGSSKAWVWALAGGGVPPQEPGLVWCDLMATHLVEWRPRRR